MDKNEFNDHPINHSLAKYFDELLKADSTEELKALPLYKKIAPEISQVLDSVIEENLDESKELDPASPRIRATAWNIERGIELEGILAVLQNHPEISRSDILILTELDWGMVRSQNRKVPHDLAAALGFNYAFAPSYINLEKGSGLEAETQGDNELGIHGNALFSRYPLRESFSISLPNGKDKMKGKEKRLGNQRVVASIVDHPSGPIRVASIHLDAHSTQRHRAEQMRLVLDAFDRFHPELPALLGGDWNTSTHNSRTALFSILGYWRRVFMGVRYVIRNHYPYPERWFERHLFQELERRGYDYGNLNEPGGCTLHYDVKDLAANGRMADWIPQWCFWFINWALERTGGRCSLKLDWFAGKGISPSRDCPPRVIADVHDPSHPLSDHDPIVLDFQINKIT